MSNATIIVIGNNPTRNAEIQKMLFKYGYSWVVGKEVSYAYSCALLIDHNVHSLTFLGNLSSWDFRETIIKNVVPEGLVTESLIAALPNAVQPAPPIPVHELTMEELNALSVKNFGYQIKIRK